MRRGDRDVVSFHTFILHSSLRDLGTGSGNWRHGME